ncbi:extracellular solute-binding protein [Bifidobacterium eulemuris]|uniref:extracellular solute-binding protein n=1 Tax=Bifidobacterium eulemuris TaxID=1765219 RepID=UPI001D035DDF|nr:extracellular solute-binding protein [Bifidobacterium eulemuris]
MLTIAVSKHSLTKNMSEMNWVSDLEAECDCVIEWQEVSSDWDQKKQAMLASGDVPDLILKGIDMTDIATYGSLFEDLSDDLDAMPNVKEMFETDPTSKKIVTETDGSIHILPSVKKGWPTTVSHLYINQQWLDAVGMDMPTTWDELYDVLVAFKEQDPNGNGEADEIPFDFHAPSTDGFGNYEPHLLLGSLGLTLSNKSGTGYFVDDNEVQNFFTDERYKEVIEYLNKLWSAGLINKEAFTHDYSTAQSTARGDGDTAKVGVTWGWTASDRFGAELADQYVAVGPLKASADQTEPVVGEYLADSLSYNTIALVVSATTKNKEAALKVANAFYGEDMSVELLWGDLGVDVEKTGDHSYKVLDPADSSKDSSTWKWTETLADDSPGWIRPDSEIEYPADLIEVQEDEVPMQSAFDAVDTENDIMPAFLQLSSDDLKTIQLNNTTILNTAMTKFSSWVTKGGVEDEWDDYVQTLKDANIDENIELYQKAYDAYMAE